MEAFGIGYLGTPKSDLNAKAWEIVAGKFDTAGADGKAGTDTKVSKAEMNKYITDMLKPAAMFLI